jgi:Protein of unknown function (DUF4012)
VASRASTGAPPLGPSVLAASVIVASFAAAVDDASPTGQPLADGVWRVLGAVFTVVSAALAGPIAGVLAGAAAAGLSGHPVLFVFGVMAVAISVTAAVRLPRHEMEAGALAGLLVSVVVYRLDASSFLGKATVEAVAVVAIVVVGAVVSGPAIYRRGLEYLAGTLTVVMGLGAVALVVAGWQARLDISAAIRDAESAQDHFRDGDDDLTIRQLGEASEVLRGANDSLTAWWVRPAAYLPLLAQHHEAAGRVVDEGQRVTEAAGGVLSAFDREALSISGGSVDLDELAALTSPMRVLATAVDDLIAAVDDVDSPWLISPIRDRLDSLRPDLIDVYEAADRAATATELAPSMLGGDEPRQYLALFATPAEARATVGLLGNWALISAVDGNVSLEAVGRVDDLTPLLAAQPPTTLPGPERYVEAYGGYNIAGQSHDATVSPHFPDVAAVVAGLFETAMDVSIDGVILADPATVAAMLRLTGPVTVGDRSIAARNAERFLLIDQYSTFPTEEARLVFLASLLSETFEAMFSIDFSDPWKMRDTFGDVVAEDRLAVVAFEPQERALLEDLGLTGGFPAPALSEDVESSGSGDLLSVVTTNRGQNKIDTFLERDIDYQLDIDSETGALDGTITVTLTNTAPATGLADAIIANNDQGLPFGTNWQQLSVYSPHTFVSATLDGAPRGLNVRTEFDLRVASTLVMIPPGDTVTVVMFVRGVVDLTDGYDLVVAGQATVNPDAVSLRVDSATEPSVAQRRTSTDWYYHVDID